MSVPARRTVFAAGLIGLVAAVLMISGGPFANNANAKPSVVDCTKLPTPSTQGQCKSKQCDVAGPQADDPICKHFAQLIERTNDKNDKLGKPNTQCASGTTPATVNGQDKCLKAGQKCKKKFKSDYAEAGFKCKGKKNKHTGKKVYKLKATGG